MGRSNNVSPYFQTLMSTFSQPPHPQRVPSSSTSPSPSKSTLTSTPTRPQSSSPPPSITARTKRETSPAPTPTSAGSPRKPRMNRVSGRPIKTESSSAMSGAEVAAAEKDIKSEQMTSNSEVTQAQRKRKLPTTPRKRAKNTTDDGDADKKGTVAQRKKKAKTQNDGVVAVKDPSSVVNNPKPKKQRAATGNERTVPKSLSTASASDRLVWEMRNPEPNVSSSGRPAPWEDIRTALEQHHPQKFGRKWVVGTLRTRFAKMRENFAADEAKSTKVKGETNETTETTGPAEPMETAKTAETTEMLKATENAGMTENTEAAEYTSVAENTDAAEYAGMAEKTIKATENMKMVESTKRQDAGSAKEDMNLDPESVKKARAIVEARFEMEKWGLIAKELEVLGEGGKETSAERLRRRFEEAHGRDEGVAEERLDTAAGQNNRIGKENGNDDN